MLRIRFQFQNIIAAGQAGHVDPLAGHVFGIDIGPALLNTLVIAIVKSIGSSIRIKLEHILQAKTDFLPERHQVRAAVAQTILRESIIMIVIVTGVENKRASHAPAGA